MTVTPPLRVVSQTWAGIDVTVFHGLAAVGVLTGTAAMLPISTLLPPTFGLGLLRTGLDIEGLILLLIATAGFAVGATSRPAPHLVLVGAAMTLAMPFAVGSPGSGLADSLVARRPTVAISMLVVFGAMLVFAATLQAATRSLALGRWQRGSALLVIVLAAPTTGSIVAQVSDPAPGFWWGMAGIGVLFGAGAYRAAAGSWLAWRGLGTVSEPSRPSDDARQLPDIDAARPAVVTDSRPSVGLRDRIARGVLLLPLLAAVLGWLITPASASSWTFAAITLLGATGVAICWSPGSTSCAVFLAAALTLSAGAILLFQGTTASTAGIPAEWPLVLVGLGALVAGAAATARAETRRHLDPRTMPGMLLCLGVVVASLISIGDLGTRPEPVHSETMRGVELSDAYGYSSDGFSSRAYVHPLDWPLGPSGEWLPETNHMLAVVLILVASGTLLGLALVRGRTRSHAEPEAG